MVDAVSNFLRHRTWKRCGAASRCWRSTVASWPPTDRWGHANLSDKLHNFEVNVCVSSSIQYLSILISHIYIYHRFIRPFDCLGAITATTMLFMSIPVGSRAQPVGSRAQHTGTRGKESSHWESALVSTQDIFWLEERTLERWNIQVEHSGTVLGNSYHFHFLVDKETLSGCCQCTGPIPVTEIYICVCYVDFI